MKWFYRVEVSTELQWFVGEKWPEEMVDVVTGVLLLMLESRLQIDVAGSVVEGYGRTKECYELLIVMQLNFWWSR